MALALYLVSKFQINWDVPHFSVLAFVSMQLERALLLVADKRHIALFAR